MRVEDPKWRERAACLGAPMYNFEIGSEDPEVPSARNVLYLAMKYCATCPVRRDCVVAALSTKDTGVVRGGIKMNDKMKRDKCKGCRLPVTTKGSRCTYCKSLRTCGSCGTAFAAKYAWLAETTCRDCITKERLASKPKRRRRIVRTPPRVRTLPRRRK